MSSLAATELQEHTESILQQKSQSESVGFDIPAVQDTLRDMLLSAFILVNFSLFLSVASLSFFNGVREDLFLAFGLFFGFISVTVAVLCSVPLLKRVLRQLRQGRATFELLCVLQLVFIVALTVSWFIRDIEHSAINLSAEYLITSMFLLFVIVHIRGLLWQRAYKALWGTVADQAGVVTVLSSVHSTATEAAVKETVQPYSAVAVGDFVRFQKGELVPFDCVVLSGVALVLERELTYRTVERQKQVGDVLYAGSSIVEGGLTCRVDSRADEARITTFTLDQSLPDVSYQGTRAALLLGALAFIAVFFTLYWYKQGMTGDTLEPVFGSFLALSLFAEWYVFRTIAPRLQNMTLYKAGVILKNSAALKIVSTLKKILVRVKTEEFNQEKVVTTIEILDDRLDKSGFLSVLFALYSGIDSDLSEVVRAYIVAEIRANRVPVTINNLQVYEELGFAAVVDGVEFSVGTEAFLIERGVHLSSTDFESNAADEVHYVALHDALVGIIRFQLDNTTLREAASAAQVRVQLSCENPQADIDVCGKALGLELADLYGNESFEEAVRRVEGQPSVALALFDGTDARILNQGVTTIAPFNRLLFEGTLSEITLIDSGLSEFLSATAVVKKIDRVAGLIDWVLPLFLAVMTVPIALSLLSSEIVLGLCALATLLLYAAFKRLAEPLL